MAVLASLLGGKRARTVKGVTGHRFKVGDRVSFDVNGAVEIELDSAGDTSNQRSKQQMAHLSQRTLSGGVVEHGSIGVVKRRFSLSRTYAVSFGAEEDNVVVEQIVQEENLASLSKLERRVSSRSAGSAGGALRRLLCVPGSGSAHHLRGDESDAGSEVGSYTSGDSFGDSFGDRRFSEVAFFTNPDNL